MKARPYCSCCLQTKPAFGHCRVLAAAVIALLLLASFAWAQTTSYPASGVIKSVTFDDSSIRVLAPGSDNWPITWGEDDNLYTTWGDGGGFGGTNKDGRVKLGVGKVVGGRDDYKGFNIAGGKDPLQPDPFEGKSLGIVAVGSTLYLWRNGDSSTKSAFKFSQLYRSDDLGEHWTFTGVQFKPGVNFPEGDKGFFDCCFCQFGKGYEGARDNHVYIHAPEIVDPSRWDLQKPGSICLMRVDKNRVGEESAYEFFAGFDGDGLPIWTKDIGGRKPVWEEPFYGTQRIQVSYNPGIKRYLLTVVWQDREGKMAIYDAPEPWGPWSLAFREHNEERWGEHCIAFSFVNKWLSADGTDFVIVYTKDDAWATIEGHFTLHTAE